MKINPFSLKGKTILITGASSGIGRQCAIDCAMMGAKVTLLARNIEKLQETLNLMEGEGHQYISFDLTNFDHIEELVKTIVATNGPIDGVIHCAGISTTEPLKITSPNKLEEFYRNNVMGSILLSKEVCKLKNYNKDGCSIIFLSSVMGIVGASMKVSYSLTKGALIAAARSLACEYAKKNIRFNCISPGVIETPINSQQLYMKNPELRKQFEAKHLLGFGQCNDISYACIYLLSNASRWVTGHNLIIDGGYTAQ